MSAPVKLSARRDQAQAFSRIALAAEAFAVSVAQLVALAVEGSARDRKREEEWALERAETARLERERLASYSVPRRVTGGAE
jgi:hypothetical protein